MKVPRPEAAPRPFRFIAVLLLGLCHAAEASATNRRNAYEDLDPPAEVPAGGAAEGNSAAGQLAPLDGTMTANDEDASRHFEAADCRTFTRRAERDIILGDPNSLAEEPPQGVHLSRGETLCVTGDLAPGGRLRNLRLRRPTDPPSSVVIALRFTKDAQGVRLALATTSTAGLHYDAYIQVDQSRLVVPTHGLPVRPSGQVSYENWRTDATELWLTEMRFVEAAEPRRPRPTPERLLPARREPERTPADRRWGMDFWLTGTVAQTHSDAINRTLAAEGFGQLPRRSGFVGFEIGAFWKRLHAGLFLRGTPYNLASRGNTFNLTARELSVGGYVGVDILLWRSLTTTLRTEYIASEVEFAEADRLPGFARTDASFYKFARGTGALGCVLGQQIDIPLGGSRGGLYALGLRTLLGYSFQVHEDSEWVYHNASGRVDGPRIGGGPHLDRSGWRVELQIGIPLYVF